MEIHYSDNLVKNNNLHRNISKLTFSKDYNISRELLRNNNYRSKPTFYPKPKALYAKEIDNEYILNNEEKMFIKSNNFKDKNSENYNIIQLKNPNINFKKYIKEINKTRQNIKRINKNIEKINPNDLLKNILNDFKLSNNQIKDHTTVDIKNKKLN